MPKKPKFELVRSSHFAWRLARRGGVWYADGRTNKINVGRHSLGTRDKSEALSALVALDEVTAVKFGLIQKQKLVHQADKDLPLTEGRRLYEDHIARPRVTGGVKSSTRKRYRSVFDKFLPWAKANGIIAFQQVDAAVLNLYATFLEAKDYAQKTLLNELTTLKQAVRWLIDAGHLVGTEPIKLKLRKSESERAYCYRPVEVEAMIRRCREVPSLNWLEPVMMVMVFSGMRIGEVVNLKWADVDFAANRITLADESGRGAKGEAKRTLKSGKGRSFPMHVDLAAALERVPRSDAYVFYGPRGGRLKADYVRRMLLKHVLTPLADQFPSTDGGRSFIDGRLHSFRHYFVSMCAASNVPERVVMEWVGHADSSMVRHYFHLHDEEAQRRMNGLNFLGGAAGRSGGQVS